MEESIFGIPKGSSFQPVSLTLSKWSCWVLWVLLVHILQKILCDYKSKNFIENLFHFIQIGEI